MGYEPPVGRMRELLFRITRAVVKAGFGVHVAVESGLLVVLVSDAGTLRVVSGGVGDLHQAPAV